MTSDDPEMAGVAQLEVPIRKTPMDVVGAIGSAALPYPVDVETVHCDRRQPWLETVSDPLRVALVAGVLVVETRRIYDAVAIFSGSSVDGSECFRRVGIG
jgi:hypothetical protein